MSESGGRAGSVVVAALLAAAIAGSSSRAQAFDLKHTSGGQTVHWAASQVTFVVDPSVAEAIKHGESAVEAAVSTWSGMSTAPGLVTTEGPAGGKVAMDGTNTILMAPRGFAFPNDALAVTVVNYDEVTGLIVDVDIVINGKHPFAVLPATARAPKGAVPVSTEGSLPATSSHAEFDLQHVVAHEVGHALGLGDDEADKSAAMYAYTMPNDASLRGPASDDANGLEAIYGGLSASPSGCGQSSVAGARPRAGQREGEIAFLAFAAAGLGRRRRAHARNPVHKA
jgi:hypothetical protein